LRFRSRGERRVSDLLGERVVVEDAGFGGDQGVARWYRRAVRWPARIGRWEVRGLLGSGGTAEVLLGVDGAEEVALKRPIAERALDPIGMELIRAEARVLARVAHPNVIRLVELIEGEPPVLALERLRGDTLAELGARGDLALALEVGVQAADALAAVHSACDPAGAPLEAVHRDVSPENLFITDEGTLRLFDFNVAFVRGHTEAPAPGAMQGRIAYMAPEQARSEPVDARADVFSLGVVLWELIVDERLFWRGNVLATLRAVVEEPIPTMQARRSPLDVELAELDVLVGAMLSRQSAARPSAGEVSARLRALQRSPREEARSALAALARGSGVVR
jgi:serine/threonine protein kinase